MIDKRKSNNNCIITLPQILQLLKGDEQQCIYLLNGVLSYIQVVVCENALWPTDLENYYRGAIVVMVTSQLFPVVADNRRFVCKTQFQIKLHVLRGDIWQSMFSNRWNSETDLILVNILLRASFHRSDRSNIVATKPIGFTEQKTK